MIAIKYSLTEGMDGAGIHIERELSTGPRNLLTIAEEFAGVRSRLKSAYGNIGCGNVWVEVNGQEVLEWNLKKLTRADYEEDIADYKAGIGCRNPDTLTDRAKDLIAWLQEQAA